MNPEALTKHLAPVLRDYVAQELKPLRARLAELEQKAAGAMNYRGVFQRADHYKKNDVVTYGGSLWFCLKSTEGADGSPGTGSGSWQLINKSR